MSTSLLVVELAVLTVLLALSAFFSASETVLFSLNSIQVQRIRDRDRKAGGRVAALLANPSRTLSTILIGNTLVNVAIASLGYALIRRLVPSAWAEAVAIPTMTVILLLFGATRLPKLGKSMGQSIRGFKTGLQEDAPIDDDDKPTKGEAAKLDKGESVTLRLKRGDQTFFSTVRLQNGE